MTSALEGGEGSASRPGRTLPPEKDPVPILQEVGWASGTVWTGEENLAPTGIRSPDRPARRQSLYRLSYASPRILYHISLLCVTRRIHRSGDLSERINLRLFNFLPPAYLLAFIHFTRLNNLTRRDRHSRLFSERKGSRRQPGGRIKLKVKVKVNLTLEQATKAQRGSRGIAPIFFNLGSRGGGGQRHATPDRCTPGKDPVPVVQEAGWATEPVWTGEEKIVPTGIRSSDRPARSKQLYRLSYPAWRSNILNKVSLHFLNLSQIVHDGVSVPGQGR